MKWNYLDLENWLRKNADKILSNGHNVMKLQLFNKYFFVPLSGEAAKVVVFVGF